MRANMNKRSPSDPSDLLEIESTFFEEGDRPPETVATASEAPVVLEAETAVDGTALAQVPRSFRRQSLRRLVTAVVGVSALLVLIASAKALAKRGHGPESADATFSRPQRVLASVVAVTEPALPDRDPLAEAPAMATPATD